jgi:hypothetical protein
MNVVGTDLSARCIEFARFNAALNDVDIDWRVGDMLVPVAGETFDLVVGQPPFIPRPEALPGVTFLHSGPMGDELALALLAGLPALLNDGGMGLVRFDAPVRRTPVLVHVREVIPVEQADVAVLSWRGPSADQEAFSYASITDSTLGRAYAQAAVAYRDHLRAHGIEAFTQAVALVRVARGGGAWTAGLPLDAPANTWSGLAAYVAALDAASDADDALLATRLTPPADLRVHAVRGFDDDAEPVFTLTPRVGSCASSGEIGDDVVALLDAFAGGHTPAAVVVAHAQVTGRPEAHSRGLVLEAVRRALTSGWLIPV